MSSLHKFKEYFGMGAPSGYEEEASTEHRISSRSSTEASRVHNASRHRNVSSSSFSAARLRSNDLPSSYESRMPSYRRSEDAAYNEPHPAGLEGEEPIPSIIRIQPHDYAEARTIGEHFREGSPIIMDLVGMSNADATRMVDFAAGLAFALHGSCDKVATKVFMLSPQGLDVSAHERRQIAETGFYAAR